MKWTKEPKENGWYWYRMDCEVLIMGVKYYIIKDNGVYISRLGNLIETGEAKDLYFYGPIEPPKFEEEGELEDD